MNAHTPGLAAALRAAQASLAEVPCPLHAAQPGGRIRAAEGLLLSSDGPEAPVGALLSADTPTGPVPCEAIGFRQGRLLMMALAEAAVAPGSAVWLDGPAGDAPAGGPPTFPAETVTSGDITPSDPGAEDALTQALRGIDGVYKQ